MMTPQLFVGGIALVIVIAAVIGAVEAYVILWWTKSLPGETTSVRQLQDEVDRLKHWRARLETRLDAALLSRTRPGGPR